MEKHEIEKEIMQDLKIKEKKSKHIFLDRFFIIIVALFIIILLILWLVPFSNIKVDPNPKKIVKIEELELNFPNSTGLNYSNRNYLLLLDPTNPFIKNTANRISILSCPNVNKQEKVCYAKAIYYFVRDNIQYVNDPVSREYLASVSETLQSGAGDCDDHAIALANLLQAIGLETRYVFIPGHVFIQVKLEEALKHYKYDGDWINLDPTCKSCKFSKISLESEQARKDYL